MRIINGNQAVSLNMEDGDSQELRNIATQLMPEFLHLFAQKNKDYGNNAGELGLRGQFADIWRKIAKLKKSMWDGEELLFEGTDEIILDLIGHLFLSLNMRRVKEEAERVYAYNEDEAAVDAFFRMVGGDPRVALASASVLNPPFRELVIHKAEEQIAADAAEAQERVRPLRKLGVLGRATTEAAAAQEAQTEGRYEADPTPLGGDFWADAMGMAFDRAKLGIVTEAAEQHAGGPVPFALMSSDARKAAVDQALDRTKTKRDVFDAITIGMRDPQMSLAEWLYRRHGKSVTCWEKLDPKFRELWEIEAKAAIQIARRG